MYVRMYVERYGTRRGYGFPPGKQAYASVSAIVKPRWPRRSFGIIAQRAKYTLVFDAGLNKSHCSDIQ